MSQQLFDGAHVVRCLESVLVFRNVFRNLNCILANRSKTFGEFLCSVIGHLFPPIDSATIFAAASAITMQITEPVTMLTDYALGVANLFFTVSILATLNSKNKVTALLLALGFLA